MALHGRPHLHGQQGHQPAIGRRHSRRTRSDPQYLALGERARTSWCRIRSAGIIRTGALSQPTVTRRQLLLPYPQYTSGPARSSRWRRARSITAMAVKAERRAASGLTFLGIVCVVEATSTTGRTRKAAAGGILNSYDLGAERSRSDVRHAAPRRGQRRLRLPFGRGRASAAPWSPLVDGLLGGWTVSGNRDVQSGYPIGIGRPSVSDGSDPALEDRRRSSSWFDTSVFSPAAPFTFGNVPRTMSDVRTDGIKNVDLTISKVRAASDRACACRCGPTCSTCSTARSSARRTRP